MVVRDFDIARVAVIPLEAKSELVVDSNAVLVGAVTLKQFQVVAGRDPQVVKRSSGATA